MSMVSSYDISKDTNDLITSAKCDILNILSKCNEEELNLITKWLNSQDYKSDLQKKQKLVKTEKQLKRISNHLRKKLPLHGEFSSEVIKYPDTGDLAECQENNTFHIDEFLYDDDDVSNLMKNGKLSRHFCMNCNSRDIKELTLISHSMAKQAIIFICKVLLPKDLDGQQILDIGSRLGAVVYGAYHFTNATHIVGVEINLECCNLQEECIRKFLLDRKRINIVHSDVLEIPEVVKSSNIIIVNVLDFFMDVDKQKQIWYYFKEHFQTGTILILNRCIISTLSSLNIEVDFVDWLTVCKPFQIENEILFDIDYSDDFYLYTVN